MPSRRQLLALFIGFLVAVLLVGAGLFFFYDFQNQTDTSVADVESFPQPPDKPAPLNASSVVDYSTTYEERLFYNDLVASHNHRLHDDESVITNCTSSSVSNGSADEFHVQLDCRGGVTDASEQTESEEFTYAVTYRITSNTTQQTDIQNYPFEPDRRFNDERS